MIIGNLRGAHHVLSEPNWKAKDKRGAGARTSGSNNNDNNNQGDDMLSWKSPTEEKLRIETQRRSQRSSRRMKVMLPKTQIIKSTDLKLKKLFQVLTSLTLKILRRRVLL